jgi:pimeloyl-ACP methyl ester carboxylesterase
MAPVIMGAPGQPALGEALTNSFCRTDPEIAKQFARVTFLSDNRADIAGLTTPTLILQSTDDLIAPIAVGEYRLGKAVFTLEPGPSAAPSTVSHSSNTIPLSQ